MISIRPARAEDQPTIRAMIREAHLDPTALKWPNFMVAEGDGQIVGIAQMKPYADCREFGSFVVRREWRSRGVGRQLIETLLSRETGDVHLMCEQHMLPYYHKFNFQLIGFGEAPRTLKIKLLVTFPGRLFGFRIVCMKRDAVTNFPVTHILQN